MKILTDAKERELAKDRRVRELLADARRVIHGELDCSTPEYRALAALYEVVKELSS